MAPGDDVDDAADKVNDLLEAGTDVPGDVPGSGNNRYVFFFSSFFSSCCSKCSSSFLHLPDDDDDLPDDDDDLPDIVSDICEGFNSSFLSLISFPGVPGSEEDGGAAEPSG